MNLMYPFISNTKIKVKDAKLVQKFNSLCEIWKNEKISISDNFIKLGTTPYYLNVLPMIKKNRDVLQKPTEICEIRINWKKESFTGLSTDEILKKLQKQYGWTVTVVDADHKRNKFKNKNIIWVIFDSLEEASRNMNIFNSMFITAMELDCIDEYKKFKQNPDKRPLTFDKLCNTAYELYDQIDKGIL